MYLALRRSIEVSLVLGEDSSDQAIAAALQKDPRFIVKGQFRSLGEAYSPTEADPPHAVICGASIVASPEFPMFDALIDMLGIQKIALHPGASAADVAQAAGLRAVQPSPPPPPKLRRAAQDQKVVAVGASTGGIDALSKILAQMPVDCPPMVIVQHIKPEFLDSVVARLDRTCAAQVVPAKDGLHLCVGQIVFAPGLPRHLEVDPKSLSCRLRDGPPVSGHRPSVDQLFRSLAPRGPNAIGVLLTGMGRDGASGLGAMRKAGAWTLAQDAASCTVFGMPRVAQDEGAVCQMVTLSDIPHAILRAARKTNGEVKT